MLQTPPWFLPPLALAVVRHFHPQRKDQHMGVLVRERRVTEYESNTFCLLLFECMNHQIRTKTEMSGRYLPKAVAALSINRERPAQITAQLAENC